MVISYGSFGTAYRCHLQRSIWSQHAFQRLWYQHVDLYGVCAVRLGSFQYRCENLKSRYEYEKLVCLFHYAKYRRLHSVEGMDVSE